MAITPRVGGFGRSTSFAGVASSVAGTTQLQTVAQRRFVFGEDSQSRSAWTQHADSQSSVASPSSASLSSYNVRGPSMSAAGNSKRKSSVATGASGARTGLFASAVAASNQFSRKTKLDAPPAMRRQQTA